MSLVLDASMVISLIMPDERDVSSDATILRLKQSIIWVPSIWPDEVMNALVVSLGRHRLDKSEYSQAVTLLRWIDPQVEPPDIERVVGLTAEIALRHGLTIYDASYVELAKRCGLPLLFRDRKLIRAAEAEGVGWLPEDSP